jgi:uncharacterized alpha-E superfamily protein
VLARIARELFWLGRSVARAEHTSRMLDGAFQADLQSPPDDPMRVPFGWSPILAVLGDDATTQERSREDVVAALTLDRENPISIVACIARAREAARMVRDVIPTETWEALNTTHLELQTPRGPEALAAGPDPLLRYVRERAALFWGLTGRTMLQDDARAFLIAGGRYETADMVLRMLLVTIGGEPAGLARDGHAQALLRAVGGLQAYRRARSAPPDAEPVARFLLFEAAYPDSVACCLLTLRTELESADQQPRSSEPVLRLGRLSADLELRRRAGGQGGLAEICEDVMSQLDRVDHDIAERYFSGALASPGVVTA